jgi:hypothetical protein
MKQPYFQVGIVVTRLEDAMEELGGALGVGWSGPVDRQVREWVLRIAFARTPPPYVELIEGPPGSVWDAAASPRIHHLGYWSEDMDADSARLEAAGIPLELDVGHARYHRGERSGTRIELIDMAYRAEFHTRWGFVDES